uniref:Immunoglobulin V-set domain-containing protein n=1 Tax=Amphilophus citrinellus TaxID=61819 RepID=A0A3Q0SQR5_AMPCI
VEYFVILFYFLFSFNSTEWCCVKYSVSISCPYEPQYQNNLKYICRGNRPSTCLQQALITSDNKQNGRFRLDDENVLRNFTVTIISLSQNDSGSYLCGVQSNSDLDVFTAVDSQSFTAAVTSQAGGRDVSWTLAWLNSCFHPPPLWRLRDGPGQNWSSSPVCCFLLLFMRHLTSRQPHERLQKANTVS